MTSREGQWNALRAILRAGNLDRVFEHQRDFLFTRIMQFSDAYVRRLTNAPSGLLRTTASVDDLIAEYQRNPHRVSALLQALAFNITPEMLVMIWMVLQGAEIEEIGYSYVRMQSSSLHVSIRLSDQQTRLDFSSNEHWDAAILKLMGLSKTDEQPMIEDFHALYVPQQPRVTEGDRRLRYITALYTLSKKDVSAEFNCFLVEPAPDAVSIARYWADKGFAVVRSLDRLNTLIRITSAGIDFVEQNSSL